MMSVNPLGSPRNPQLSEVDVAHVSSSNRNMEAISSISSLQERNECSDGCQTFWEIISYPFVLIFQIISWPFIALYNLIFGETLPPPPPLPVFDEAIMKLAEDYKINQARLGEVPEKIDFAELTANLGGAVIPLNELLTQYDAVFGAPHDFPRNDISYEKRAENRQKLADFVAFIEARDTSYSQTSLTYFDDLNLVVQNIIFELRKPADQVEMHKKVSALDELAEASDQCIPRRFEDAVRQFKVLTNRPTTLDNLFLGWVQELKEDIILECFQQDEYHVLNHARKEIGEEWGLDRENGSLAEDRFYALGFMGARNPELYRRALAVQYIPARVISALYEKQKYYGRNQVVNDYLGSIAAQLPDDFDYGEFFEADGKTVSIKGIAFLLESLHFFEKV